MNRALIQLPKATTWWIALAIFWVTACSQAGHNASFRQSDDSEVHEDRNDQDVASAGGDQTAGNQKGLAPNPLAGMNLTIESQSFAGAIFRVVIVAKGENLGKIDWKAVPLSSVAKLECTPKGETHYECSGAAHYDVSNSSDKIQSVPVAFDVKATGQNGKEGSLHVLLATMYNLGQSATISSATYPNLESPQNARMIGAMFVGDELRTLWTEGKIVAAKKSRPEITVRVPTSQTEVGTNLSASFIDLIHELVTYQFRYISLFDSSLSLGNFTSPVTRTSWMNWIVGTGQAEGISKDIIPSPDQSVVWRDIVTGSGDIVEVTTRGTKAGDVGYGTSFAIRIYNLYVQTSQSNGMSSIQYPEPYNIDALLPLIDGTTSSRPQVLGMFRSDDKIYMALVTTNGGLTYISCDHTNERTDCAKVQEIAPTAGIAKIRGFEGTVLPDDLVKGDFTATLLGGISADATSRGIHLMSSKVLGLLTKHGNRFTYDEKVNLSPRYQYGSFVAGTGNDKALVQFAGEPFDSYYGSQGQTQNYQAMMMAGKMTNNNAPKLMRISSTTPFLSVIHLDGSQATINIKTPALQQGFELLALHTTNVSRSLAQILDFVNWIQTLSASGGSAEYRENHTLILICPHPGKELTCHP